MPFMLSRIVTRWIKESDHLSILRSICPRNFTYSFNMDKSSDEYVEPRANGKKPRFNKADHPVIPKQPKPPVGKNEDGSWGPTGLYGSRVKETKLLSTLRDVIKPSRLKRVEEVLASRCSRVHCLFENLHDPANGAACLRTMEGFGLLEAHAVEAYEPFKVQGGITMNADKVRH